MHDLAERSASCNQGSPCSAEPASVGQRWMEAMRRGDFEAAWRETDRLELPRRAVQRDGAFTRAPHHLTWDGTPFDGRRVLVRCEHGLGDTIQFLRYCPLLRSRASNVAVKVQPLLMSLFLGMAGIDTLLDAWTTDPEPEHDVDIECMELTYAFRHTSATIPAAVPYLPVETIRAEARGAYSLPSAGPKIGLVWAASGWDPQRSIPLRALEPLARVPGARFFSLQQGPEQGQLAEAGFPITPLSTQTAQIREAAAAMLALDLIISVDSMTAHLAGALGRPVWVLLKHQADWRWQGAGELSPWYPTMRLLRQERPGDWEGVVARVAAAARRAEM